MIVTDITELDNKRCKVFIDGEMAFFLYKGELRDYGIKSGAEISSGTYEEITTVLLPKRAIKRAMNLLQKRDYTESKLREKLREGLYSDECIDAAIDYVKSYKYLDDERYVRDYITYRMETRSRKRIEMDLMQKGIIKDLISKVMSELYESEDNDYEMSQIHSLLVKKHYSSDMEYADKQKILAFLLRKGYDMEAVRSAMNEF